MTISECVRSSHWWGWSNLWGTIAADRWAWFIGKKFAFFRRKTPLLRLEFFSFWVESRCGAVALGRTYLLPPLSSGGASMVPPWLRFHIPLIEPDRQVSRIRLVWGFLCQGGVTPFWSSFAFHSFVRPAPRASSVPTAYFHRRRAQRRSRTALLQRRRRLVLDGREHGGRVPAIGWLAAR